MLERQAGTEAWALWRESHELERANRFEVMLLPLVFRNLGDALSPGDLAKLGGAYRATWVRNQLFFAGAAGALRLLQGAGVETMLLKGAALAVSSYRDTGARTMEDIDILVPRADADRALAALVRGGWRTDPRGRLRSEHAQSLQDGAAAHVLDLHWYSLARSGDDRGFWERSVPIEIHGVPTRALSPADELLHAAAHGGEWGAITPVRWMADAAVVVRAAPDVDWDVFVAEAIGRRMTLILAAALEHLRDAVDVPVPDSVFGRLRVAPKSRLERRVHRAVTEPNGGGSWWLVEYERFRRRAALDSSLRLSDFLKDHFGVERRRELVVPVSLKAGSIAAAHTRRLVRRRQGRAVG